MNVMLPPAWTQEAFLQWVGRQEEPYEFDGTRPVGMNGGTFAHNLIGRNIVFALHSRLRGSGSIVLGAGAGVETAEGAVRYPDAFVTAVKPANGALLIAGAVVAFEVVSPSSERTDRLVKLREYAAVPSLLRYLVVEQSSAGVSVFSRSHAADPWVVAGLTELGDVLALPEINLSIPLLELYDGVDFEAGQG